jgi:hypothetical protein
MGKIPEKKSKKELERHFMVNEYKYWLFKK